jgi:predicted acylesterase/phospholipase RssA
MESTTEPPIEHLVIAGGGASGISIYGVLRESHKSGFWNISNIKTIYGTSIGAIIAIFIALQYPWDDLDEYILKRPWQNVFKFDIKSLLYAYDNRGIFDKKIIEELIGPLLKGKDLDATTTLLELYEKTNIEIHITTTELNEYELVDISHKTQPEWSVIDAVYCSASLPLLFSPVLKDGKCYVDGGTMMNYPLSLCVNNIGEERLDSIFGINLAKSDKSTNLVTSESTLFDHISILLNKVYDKSCYSQIPMYNIKNEIIIDNVMISIYDIINASSSYDQRLLLITKGVELWEKYQRNRLEGGSGGGSGGGSPIYLVPETTN